MLLACLQLVLERVERHVACRKGKNADNETLARLDQESQHESAMEAALGPSITRARRTRIRGKKRKNYINCASNKRGTHKKAEQQGA